MAIMMYPYPSYVPNKIIAGCTAAAVGISLIAWLIQSCQVRFRPYRSSILILLSHIAVFVDLIVRAAVNDQQDSSIMFSILNGLLTLGQRMVLVANFSFVLEIHCEKTRLMRGVFLGALTCILVSALLVIPANMASFHPDEINTSLLYRKISAAVFLVVVLCFYLILYWSNATKNMTIQAILLSVTVNTMCLMIAIANLIQSISLHYYDQINKDEGFFYGLQMLPIILAHFAWSICHPKRSVKSLKWSSSETNDDTSINEQQHLLKSESDA